MLTVEIKSNEKLITKIEIVNKGKADRDYIGDDWRKYKYAVTQYVNNEVVTTYTGVVHHERGDGAEYLVSLVLEDYLQENGFHDDEEDYDDNE
jgi:hypothetical protein